MLCPNCGTKTTTDHKFCRNCGMNLEPVAKAMAAHLAQDGAESPVAEEGGERRYLRRRSSTLAAAGIGVMLIGMLLISIAKMFSLRPSYMLFGVIAMLLGAFILTLAALAPWRAAGRPRRAHLTGALEGAKGTVRLLHESTLEPVTSVTERTTDLLGVEMKAAKPRQD